MRKAPLNKSALKEMGSMLRSLAFGVFATVVGLLPAVAVAASPSLLFNDRQVHSAPTVIVNGRVLSGLVQGKRILVPLRAMFEAMGASVRYDANSKRIEVRKPGAAIELWVGKNVARINGQQRVLHSPPILRNGRVLVPIRVLSETMGAYVKWVPGRRIAVVRYVVPTPLPAPASTPAPVVAPTPTSLPAVNATPFPLPASTPKPEAYLILDYFLKPKVYNEFSPGNTANANLWSFRTGEEFHAFRLNLALDETIDTWIYPHNCNGVGDPQCMVTTIGGNGSAYVPAFQALDRSTETHLGIKIAEPRIYLAAGYMVRTTRYGYPPMLGLGYGIMKLPDLDRPFSLYASLFYYPRVKGGNGLYDLGYHVTSYRAGFTYNLGKSPLFVDGGYVGDSGTNAFNAPSGFSHSGAFLGLGLKI
uniref:Copper amine oxidase-like N-terminal domain-containing protein n=1 Tax=mine drainage metagenome TaxID=410659 RepID=E6PDM1_9ZZZZ